MPFSAHAPFWAYIAGVTGYLAGLVRLSAGLFERVGTCTPHGRDYFQSEPLRTRLLRLLWIPTHRAGFEPVSRPTCTVHSVYLVPPPLMESRLFQALEVPLRSASAPPPDRVVLLLFQDATVSIALLRPAFTEGSDPTCAAWRVRPSGPDCGLVQPAAYGLPTARRCTAGRWKGKREKKAREPALYSHAYIVNQYSSIFPL